MSEVKPKSHGTYYDLEALPARYVGEIVSGELYASPRPASLHAYATSRLGAALDTRYGDDATPGGWLLLDEPELHLLGHVLVPDLAGWRRERMPKLENVAYFQLAPDWICEVLSPATLALDRQKKLPIYARAGIAHAWLIDPLVRTLEVFRLEDETYRLLETFSGDASVQPEPFIQSGFPLQALWAP
ncbi:MAG: Uma2 family endonuclease [Myxococcota bacterium]|nr:Uma2 family endonuclease [Myxococcota bacterium]